MAKQISFSHTATGAAASPLNVGAGKTARTIYMKVTTSAPDAVVALETSADNVTWTEQDRVTGSGWASAASHHARQYARPNVISKGTGAPNLQTVITYN